MRVDTTKHTFEKIAIIYCKTLGYGYLEIQKIKLMQRYRVFSFESPTGKKILEFSLPDQMIMFCPFEYYYLTEAKEKVLVIKERLQGNTVLTISCNGSAMQCTYTPSTGYKLQWNIDIMTTKTPHADESETISFRRS